MEICKVTINTMRDDFFNWWCFATYDHAATCLSLQHGPAQYKWISQVNVSGRYLQNSLVGLIRQFAHEVGSGRV